MIDDGQKIFSNGICFEIDGLGVRVTVEADDGRPWSERLDSADASQLADWLNEWFGG